MSVKTGTMEDALTSVTTQLVDLSAAVKMVMNYKLMESHVQVNTFEPRYAGETGSVKDPGLVILLALKIGVSYLL